VSAALFRAWRYMASAGLASVVVDLRMVDDPARDDVEWFPHVVAATRTDGRPALGTFGPLADLVWSAAREKRVADGPVLLPLNGAPRRVVVEPCACDPEELPCGGCGGQRVVYWPKEASA